MCNRVAFIPLLINRPELVTIIAHGHVLSPHVVIIHIEKKYPHSDAIPLLRLTRRLLRVFRKRMRRVGAQAGLGVIAGLLGALGGSASLLVDVGGDGILLLGA
jgi:LmbE family N-acetylglucosaminyl deacetylase